MIDRKQSLADCAFMENDRQWLEQQAYHRMKWADGVLTRYDLQKAHIPDAQRPLIATLYAWFLAPITLWPINIHELMERVLDVIENGKEMDDQFRLIIELLPSVPSKKTQLAVINHERDVQGGAYEHLIAAVNEKFTSTEREARRNKKLISDWKQIGLIFDLAKFRNEKGVIRRTMIPERNLRLHFDADFAEEQTRFQAAFDAFCAKWNLYGMDGDTPLLQKLTVNLTPNGTMIFIPAYWSFDAKRDLKWGVISKLHKSREQKRQGPALAEGQEIQRQQAAKLRELDKEARIKKLRGEARHEFLCAGLGLDPRTSQKRLYNLRKMDL